MRIPLLIFSAAIVGSSFEVAAQDLNLFDRLQTIQPSIAKSQELNSISGAEAPRDPRLKTINGKIVCEEKPEKKFLRLTPEQISGITPDKFADMLHKSEVPDIDLVKKPTKEETTRFLESVPLPAFDDLKDRSIAFVAPIAIDQCQKQRQLTTVRFSMPFNPTYETNALKSSANAHEDHSFGMGGQVLIATGGFRLFDVMAVSAGTASTRYDKFTNKSVDSLSVQAIYQFFLHSFAYKDGVEFPIDEKTPKNAIYPSGLVTFDTLSIAVQNQAAFMPTFKTRTADVLTPQIQLTRSNISLLGASKSNECSTTDDAYKKHAYCYFADIYLNVGQTFSDVKTQENINGAVSLTLGNRIDKTNWKVAVQATVTDKSYQNVVGGRHDVLWQTGPSISYAHPALPTPVGAVSMNFNLPVTYSNNHSSLATAEWHGWVVMPTITLAFVPK